MTKELTKTYEPSSVEARLYKKWEDNGYFHAVIDENKKPFTIVIPPPNVTGQLHMGHALDETLQDILIRYKRMQGFCALWLPGTDHAGIATQIKVEAEIREKEGLTRHDLGREEFLSRVWDWKERFGGRIISQLKKMGSSCDWDRLRFTMDEGCSKAVKEAFVNLYDKGLIYKGNRIINWCPSCATALSDAEVEYKEEPGHFWHIKYFVKDSDEYIVVATTRPETLLGDTAVAVHPDDERYASLVGKTLILPLVGREIPVVADEYVDKEFGTGCVKITPAHDPNDFEVGLRHNLEQIKVLDDNGRINSFGGKYEGQDRYEARKNMVADLEKGGYLEKIEEHVHNVGHCYRCGNAVEPLTSDQWFVKMKPLAGPAMDAVKDGRITFVPDRFGKTYLHWMENIRDWCISRQLWWGHQIPAYYCDDCGHMEVSKEDVTVCPKCQSKNMHQDGDVLDTWFSSALWPFSTLGWPDKTEDLEYFYPTNVLVTGYDIIPFWVARMIFSGLEHMDKAPFEHVFIHGLVRDEQGRKMSKSLGNGIDPMEVADEFGADALRFTLATGNSPGNDMRFSKDRVEASRNFGNKIWNAARFVLMNAEDVEPTLADEKLMTAEDKWILSRYNTLVQEVTEALDKFDVGIALSKIYTFIWDEYCDWYIELSKPRLYNKDNPCREAAQKTLVYVLLNTMKLLHPFMPFITEEIFCAFMGEDESIMISAWPTYDAALSFPVEERTTSLVCEAIRSIRNVRAQMNVPPSKKATLYILAQDKAPYEQGVDFLEKLAYASQVVFIDDKAQVPENSASCVTEGAQLYIPMGELVNIEKEVERLMAEKEKLLSEIARVDGLLANESFVKKAPEKLVAAEKEKKEKFVTMLAKVEETIASYK